MSAPNRKVAWIKPQEPSFIKAFKSKVGYREPETIEAKRAKVAPAVGEGGEVEREEELPTVVVLEKGDVGEEEYKKFREAMKDMEKEGLSVEEVSDVPTVPDRPRHQSPPASSSSNKEEGGKEEGGKEEGGSGKLVFKRPVKRRRSSEGVLDASTKKTGGEGEGKTRSPRSRKGSGSSSAVKNSSLLSFGDEEEDT